MFFSDSDREYSDKENSDEEKSDAEDFNEEQVQNMKNAKKLKSFCNANLSI